MSLLFVFVGVDGASEGNSVDGFGVGDGGVPTREVIVNGVVVVIASIGNKDWTGGGEAGG